MSLTEEQMLAAEEQFVELGRVAVERAVERARKLGITVTVGIDGDLFEVRPDGSRKFLKKLPPRVATKPGQHFKIK